MFGKTKHTITDEKYMHELLKFMATTMRYELPLFSACVFFENTPQEWAFSSYNNSRIKPHLLVRRVADMYGVLASVCVCVYAFVFHFVYLITNEMLYAFIL